MAETTTTAAGIHPTLTAALEAYTAAVCARAVSLATRGEQGDYNRGAHQTAAERLDAILASYCADADLLVYLSDWVDVRDVLFRVSGDPENWRRDDTERDVIDVRHWHRGAPEIHDTVADALRRERAAETRP